MKRSCIEVALCTERGNDTTVRRWYPAVHFSKIIEDLGREKGERDLKIIWLGKKQTNKQPPPQKNHKNHSRRSLRVKAVWPGRLQVPLLAARPGEQPRSSSAEQPRRSGTASQRCSARADRCGASPPAELPAERPARRPGTAAAAPPFWRDGQSAVRGPGCGEPTRGRSSPL